MFLLTVIPVTRQKGIEELSYFSKVSGERGDIVDVPLRGRIVPAIILSAQPVADAKSLIRRGNFALKKIKGVPHRGALDPASIDLMLETAQFHAGRPGATLATLVAKEVLHAQNTHVGSQAEVVADRPVAERLALIAPYEERLNQYRLLVREEFARGGSALLLAPTQIEAETLYETLSKGIEHYAYLFHGGLSNAVLKKRIKAMHEEVHPVLCIVTYPFLLVPRFDMQLMMIERENAESYRTIAPPFVDVRRFAERLAQVRGTKLVRAGYPLLVSTVVALQNAEYEELAPSTRRQQSLPPIEVVDAKEDYTQAEARGEAPPAYAVFSEQTKEHIMRTLGEKKRILVLATRKGLSPITVCGDCGTPVVCQLSGTPMTLVKSGTGNQFLCRSCGDRKHSHTVCAVCGSWKLVPLGAGIERIEDTIQKQFPDTPLVVMDSDRVKSHKEAYKRVHEFFSADTPSILLGTELMLPYLLAHSEKADTAIIPSMDTLLSHPAWNAFERSFGLIIRLAECVRERLVIQTRMGDNTLLSYVLSGDTGAFYESEIDARKMLGYPPFSVLIKLTATGTDRSVRVDMAHAEALLAPAPLLGVNTPIHQGKKVYALHGFLRVDAATWPDQELLQKILALPPSITCVINPSSVL